jgi:hypothetical protein
MRKAMTAAQSGQNENYRGRDIGADKAVIPKLKSAECQF